MFARISTFNMKPESIADAEAKIAELMPTVMAMDGMVTFTLTINADGSGVVVSVIESEEQSNANQEQVAALWAQFGDFLAAPPEVTGYRVLQHQSN
jgi:quinol monooxygenase YgiN